VAAPSRLPETERRNPQARGLDRLSTRELLRRMNREDARVARAVARAVPAIARAVDAIAARLARGGRLLYVGAGTSGRLAVLDAAECPPTFGISPQRIQAVIAGGRRALTRAVEGAEDSAAEGARALARRRVTSRDAVVGLAASGTTLFVLGALRYARRRGAATIAVTANPRTPLARAAEIAVVVRTGPEIIAGSTRLKAGTAQKLVLNMLSTAAMVRLGRAWDGWMTGVALTNRKLRARGLRILRQAAGTSVSEARRALRQAGHNLPVALVMLLRGVSAGEARRRLGRAGGSVAKVLGGRW
jgi:N-acetylmuramic acid 6-phosphate etherase